MTPAEKLIVHTVKRELEDGDTDVPVAIDRSATRLGIASERVLEVYAKHGGVS